MKICKIAKLEKEAIAYPPKDMEFYLKIFYQIEGSFDSLHDGFDTGIVDTILSKFPKSTFRRQKKRGLGVNNGTILYTEDEAAKVLDLLKQLRTMYPSKVEGGKTLKIGKTEEDLYIAEQIGE